VPGSGYSCWGKEAPAGVSLAVGTTGAGLNV
jgi:hypothetical protein